MEIQRRVSPGGGRPSAPWTTTHYLLPRPQRGWHGAGSGGPGRACSHFPPGGRRVGERGLGRTSGQLRTPCPGSAGRGAGWRLDSSGGSCVRGVGTEAASLQGGDLGCRCHSVKPQGEPVSVCCPGGRKGGVGRVECGVGSGPPPTMGVRVTAAQKSHRPVTQGPWSRGHLRGALAPPVQAGARRPVPRRS